VRKVEPDSEDGVRSEALEPGLRRLRRLGGSHSETEKNLQNEERKHDRADAIEPRNAARSRSFSTDASSCTYSTRRPSIATGSDQSMNVTAAISSRV